jgi:hypothetical protein
VSPPAVQVRRRTRFKLFTFVASGPQRVAVPGVSVVFAGRRLVTNQFGHAFVRVTFPVVREAHAFAFKEGVGGASASVFVLPRVRHVEPGERPCAGARWRVKTASDRRAPLIDPNPIDTSLTWLWKLRRHGVGFGTPRLVGIERHVYRMYVRLVSMQLEPDRDIHLVVAEPGHPLRTMITELPDVRCYAVNASRFRAQMYGARSALHRACHGAGLRQRRIVGTATITGVGFWDSRHGQYGVARNGIELHPLLDLQASGCRRARR